MFALLEFIFQGFFEWVYSLILDIWNYFTSSLLDVMSLDFAYLKTHIPVMGDIQQIILAVGWALLLGNLVFQALRSMASGLGFEGEDPKLLFARTFVFGFLLLSSPQICENVLGMTSQVIALIEIPDAINVQLVDGSVIGVFTASWLLVIIFDLITMFMVFSLLLEVAERYMVLAMLTVMAPLAFAMGGSKSTSEIFVGWCRMFGSMCLLTAINIVFFKMLLSVVSTVPSFPDVFLWMILVVSIVKVAKKADEIITRIGLNPAITGNRSTLPGMIAYTVVRTALSMVTKGAANGIGGALGLTGKAAAGVGKSVGVGKRAAGTAFKGAGRGFRGAAGAVGGIGGAAAQAAGGPSYGGGRMQTSQTDTRQAQQTHSQQEQNQQNASQTQTGGQRTGPCSTAHPVRSSRKTSIQPGIRRGSSYVTPPDSQSKPENKSASSGGFTGFQEPQGGGLGGADAKPTTSRRGDTFGGKSSGTYRGAGFGGMLSQTSQKTEISLSGIAEMENRSTQRPPPMEPQHSRNVPPAPATSTLGTQNPRPVQQEQHRAFKKGKPLVKDGGFVPQSGTAGKQARSTQWTSPTEPRHSRNVTPAPATSTLGAQNPRPVQQEQRPASGKDKYLVKDGGSVPQSGTAGKQARSTQRTSPMEPRHSRNVPPAPATPTSGTQSSSPAQQEHRQASGKDKPPMKGGGSVPRPGIAETAKPPATKLSGGKAPGSQPSTAGMQARSTKRPPVSEPRHSRNTPPAPATPMSEARSSSPVQQEQRRTSGKDKPPVTDGGSIPRPGMAGTAPGSRPPPGQKLNSGPSKQKPPRQTKREGGPTNV